MTANRQSKQKSLAQSDRQRSVVTRSTLTSRGLELASLLRHERENIQTSDLAVKGIILPARKVQFPTDRPMGTLFSRRWNNQIVTKEGEWHELGPARGEFNISQGVELMIDLVHTDPVDLSPLSTFRPNDLQRIGAANTRLDDEGMDCLKKLTGLIELWLMGTEITDNGLRSIQKMSGIRVLNLGNTCVTDDGLQYIEDLINLFWLFLDFTRISDAGVEHLKCLANLKVLTLNFTQVTEAGTIRLRNALPNCSISNIRD